MSRRYRNAKRQRQQIALEVTQSEYKQNPAYAGIISYGDSPQPKQMPKNYKSYFDEGYKGNDTIFKCVNYILTNGAAIPPVLYTDKGMKKKIEKHPLLDKLDQPNVEQTGVAYRKALIGSFLVTGNAIQYAIRKGTIGPPDELWILEPNKVKKLPTKTRGIVGYEYDDFEGNSEHPIAGQNPIPFQNINHLKTWALTDPLWGVSPIEVGAIKVDQQTSAQKWNLSLLQNGGKMSGAFVTPVTMDPNTRAKVEEKLNEKIAGPRNAGKYRVLDGGLTFQQTGVAPNQMDWLPGIQYNAGSLANLYNMPPQLVGDTSSTTYDNMEQAKSASYTEEIFPVLDDVYAQWNMWLLPMYPDLCDAQGKPTAYLYYDKKTVEVVQAVISAKQKEAAQRANDAWMKGTCTLNEAREMQELPPVDGGDVFRFGSVLVRESELDEYAEQSLQKPAAPPMPVPEPMLNQPTTGGPPTNVPNNHPAPGGANKPAPANNPDQSGGKSLSTAGLPGVDGNQKALDANGVYQADDTQARVSAYSANGVTHVRWVADPSACDVCTKNDGQTVELGDPFPSGHILPPAHPHCPCVIVTYSIAERGKSREVSSAHTETNDLSFDAALSLLDLETADRSHKQELPQGHDGLSRAEEKARRRKEYQNFIRGVLQ